MNYDELNTGDLFCFIDVQAPYIKTCIGHTNLETGVRKTESDAKTHVLKRSLDEVGRYCAISAADLDERIKLFLAYAEQEKMDNEKVSPEPDEKPNGFDEPAKKHKTREQVFDESRIILKKELEAALNELEEKPKPEKYGITVDVSKEGEKPKEIFIPVTGNDEKIIKRPLNANCLGMSVTDCPNEKNDYSIGTDDCKTCEYFRGVSKISIPTETELIKEAGFVECKWLSEDEKKGEKHKFAQNDEKEAIPPGMKIIRKYVSQRILDLQAVGNRIIVLPDTPETMSQGGIHIPQKSEEAVEFGWVISEGPDCTNKWVGKYIWYGRWLGAKAELDGLELRVFDEDENYPLAVVQTNKILRLQVSPTDN